MRGARRYPRPADAGDLFPEARALLVGGWAAPWWPTQSDDPTRIFMLSEEDMGAIWRAHRRELMADAARRGIAEPFGLRYDDTKEDDK